MDSKLYRALTAMLWLALPLTALQYWSVWDQLPGRMATHFGAAGQPNGWMTRETSLIFALVVTDAAAGGADLGADPGPQAGCPGLVAAGHVVRRDGRPVQRQRGGAELQPPRPPAEHCPCSGRGVHRGDCRDRDCPGEPSAASNCRAMLTWSKPKKFTARCCGRRCLPCLTAIEVGRDRRHSAGRPALGHGLARVASAGSSGAGLERLSLSLHRPWSRDQHAGFSPALDPARKHQGVCDCALESDGRLRHSRHWRTPRLRLGKHRCSHRCSPTEKCFWATVSRKKSCKT